MNIEDVKIGETYYVPFTVKAISDKYVTATTGGTLAALLLAKTLHPIPTAPKYDPCRKLRKGDRVHMKPEVNGRPVYIGEDAWEPLDPNEIWTVEEDELETGWVRIKTDCVHATVWHAMLELVTPVEELEPYSVVDAHTHWDVADKNMKTVATYSKGYHPNAKAAAEAERDRLNAEHRKERK